MSDSADTGRRRANRRGGSAVQRSLASLVYVVLGLLAAAGVALSAAFLLVSTDLGRGLLVPRLVGLVNGAIAGRIELARFHVLGEGGLELEGLRVRDPDGEVVLAVRSARVFADLSRLRSRAVGFRAAVDGVDVLLRPAPDGGLTLARALAPRAPRPPSGGGGLTWTVRATRLTVRDAALRWLDAEGGTRLAAEGLDADGRGAFGPRGARAELAVTGRMTAPEAAPLSLGLVGSLRGSTLRVRQLRAAVGETALDVAGELDTASWRGRVAVLSLAADAAGVRRAAPRSPLAGDLRGTLYAESDGREATAALELSPREGGGSARGAAAARLPPAGAAAGATLRLAGLDLSRVLRGAPSTALTLDADARAAGTDLASLRGTVRLSLAPSRLRRGRLGPVELRATAAGGAVEVARLEASLPGASLRGSGRWRRGGAVAGQAVLEATDLAAARRELEASLDRALPPLAGAGRVEARLSGTEEAPQAAVRVTSPRLEVGGFSAAVLALDGTATGPLGAPRARLDGTASRLAVGGLAVRDPRLGARLEGRAAEVTITGAVPELGPAPLELRAQGALDADGRAVDVSALTLAWPGARFALEAPAQVVLEGPSVDRLALASGPQRLALSGGLRGQGAAKTLDARAEVRELDLGGLPGALWPRELRVAGRLTARVEARGRAAAPSFRGEASLAGGAVQGLTGLEVRADAAWDAAARRLTFAVQAERAEGGEVAARGELPLPLARAPRGAPVSASAELRGLPLAGTLRAVGVAPPLEADGTAALDLALSGTAGAPELTASAALDDGRVRDLDGLRLLLRLEAAGKAATLAATLDHRGARALDAEVVAPARLEALLRAPGPELRRLAAAPLRATASVPGFELAAVSGKLGVPEELRGRLTARAELSGPARAPRGKLVATLSEGAWRGYAGVGLEATLTATERATELSGQAALAGEALGTWRVAVALPPERLGSAPALEAAALEASLDVPGADLRRAEAGVPLAGQVSAHARFGGSLAVPRLAAELSGHDLVVAGHPLGELNARASGERRALHAELHLAVAGGGALDGDLVVEADPALPALRRGDVASAPARATLNARNLDLGFLPALAPQLIRSAGGKLQADLTARGPLARMAYEGSVGLAAGRVALTDLGEWTDVEGAAVVTPDVLELTRLAARRGGGEAELRGRVTGLSRRASAADVQATLRAEKLEVARAGQTLFTLDLEASATGKVSNVALSLDVQVPSGTVRLPDRNPRKIQSLARRPDIVVGPFPSGATAPLGPEAEGRPYPITLHVVAPNRLLVRSDKPAMNVELRADATAELSGGPPALTGEVQVLRGTVAPIPGRGNVSFDLKRARAEFTGAGYETAALDVQAEYDSGTNKVYVAVSGTIAKPQVKLTSDPAMDESQIALYLATGRTQFKSGGGGVSNFLDQQSSGALGTFAGYMYNELLRDKLPFAADLSIEPTRVRAGTYLSDKIYVGYTRLMNARTELGENVNEFTLDYRISRQWHFEFRAGDTGSGGASLLWSKDY